MSEPGRTQKKTTKSKSQNTSNAQAGSAGRSKSYPAKSKQENKRASVRKPSKRNKSVTKKGPGKKPATNRPQAAISKKKTVSSSPKAQAEQDKKPTNKATEKAVSSNQSKGVSEQKETRAKGGRKSGKSKSKQKARLAATRPILQDESATLLNLEDLLSQRIVGKDSAIKRVANVIRIRRTKLDFKPHRPDGTFLIVGPAGVGKAEFASAVAEVLLGSDHHVLNLDMTDYTMEEDIEDLLVTAYPGAEGVLVEGALTTPIRKNPRTVVLFRGIERANPAVLRLLLHAIERGAVQDAQGEASFSETIIFATTRLEFDEAELVEQIGFTRSTTPREERCRKILEEQFSPELVGVFNEVLYFNSLTPQDVKLIARFKVNAVLERLKSQKCGVIVSDRVYDTFIREDEVKKAGARYLNRALEEKLFTPLSKYLLENSKARSIIIDIQDGELVIKH